MNTSSSETALVQRSDHFSARFSAMASPCEVLIDTLDEALARKVLSTAQQEARRIEDKFSRYKSNNIVHKINNAQGQKIDIDAETADLLNFANTCFTLSEGLFDITSGALRRCWVFDGSDKLASQHCIDQVLPFIGWQHVKLSANTLQMPAGFEIDLGGIGKEYAVDKVARLCSEIAPSVSMLVNFGGDIQVTRPRREQPYWQVGIEVPAQALGGNTQHAIVNIANGGLATSGDANRYLLKDGVRYSHILQPKTGHPIAHAPRSVTVASDHCVQSGLLATLALLQGKHAETFLQQQGCKHWCYW